MSSAPSDRPSILRVCIIGPECTGKTTLAASLAERFQTAWVPEYARGYLDKLNRPYQVSDLLKIAHGQIRMEEEWMQNARRLLICDTNLMVIRVWSEHKFGTCDPEIIRLHESRRYDLYLLTDIDVPWEEDPQREHPQLRDHFMGIYSERVRNSGVPFERITGDSGMRLQQATAALAGIGLT